MALIRVLLGSASIPDHKLEETAGLALTQSNDAYDLAELHSSGFDAANTSRVQVPLDTPSIIGIGQTDLVRHSGGQFAHVRSEDPVGHTSLRTMKHRLFPGAMGNVLSPLGMMLPLALALWSQIYTCRGQTFTWPVQEGGNGHSYEFVKAPRISWPDAEAAAAAKGGYLATVTSQAENDFLNSHKTVTYFWIGGYQPDGSPEPDGGWTWITGETFGYKKWSPTEPNNYNGVEKYIEFDGTLGSWNDNLLETGPTDFGYVIEYGTPSTAVSLQSGLVAFFPFSGTADDASGNGHDGSVNGAILTSDRFGNSASAYRFDGVSSNISVPTSPDLDLVGNFTIACWVKPTRIVEAPNNFDILAKHNAGAANAGTYHIQLANPSGTVVFAASPYFDPYTASASAPQANSWTHVAFTYFIATGTWNMYVNGQLNSSGTRDYNLQHNSINFLIGAEYHPTLGLTGCFNGNLDDIRIYNRVLSTAEVDALARSAGALPPAIVVQPKSQVIQVGRQATFNIVAEGAASLSYQWRRNGVNIDGATSRIFTVTNVAPADSSVISVSVQNAYGSITSGDASLYVYLPPPGSAPSLPNTTPAQQALSIAQAKKPRVPSSTQLQSFGSNALVDPNKMTIVMTHGWKSDAFDWPFSMANALKAYIATNPGSYVDDHPNILAWDWHENAQINPLDPVSSANRTPSASSR